MTTTEDKVRAWRIAATILAIRSAIEGALGNADDPAEKHIADVIVPSLRQRANIIERRVTHAKRKKK